MPAKMTAKKLAKMSEEDRALYLEQQRIAEEEAQKKKEEMLSRFLKDKLAKEEAAAKLNMVKLKEQWRSIMRRMKTDELKKDTLIMKEEFERVVDRKDAIIHSLARDIEEAEEQYQVALRSHIQNTEELLQFQQKRINDMEKGFQKDLDNLKLEFDDERSHIIAGYDQELKDLHDVMYAMELKYTEREKTAQQEFQGVVDELKNKNLEETHALSAQHKGVMDSLWLELRKETEKYKEATEEKKLRFEALKKKDESNAKEIAKQMKRLNKLQTSIKEIKARLSSNAKETENRLATIQEERDSVLAHFHELKGEMLKSREKERENLTKLTLQSNKAIKGLEGLQDKGTKIIQMAEMCRKFETEEEKVLPFFARSLTSDEEEQVKSVESEEPFEDLTKVLQQYSSLDNFWRRYNKVLLDKLALDKEKDTLQEENKQLRVLLKQYLDGISVNPETLSRRNALFVVSSNKTPPQLTGIPLGDPRVQRKSVGPVITVIEAAHVVKNIA